MNVMRAVGMQEGEPQIPAERHRFQRVSIAKECRVSGPIF
jgi:hypothetical protein